MVDLLVDLLEIYQTRKKNVSAQALSRDAKPNIIPTGGAKNATNQRQINTSAQFSAVYLVV